MVSRICVFCGSAPGSDPKYLAAARELGTRLAAAGVGVVYGGNVSGLMGALADATLAGGGAVTGVIPRGVFSREMPHLGLTELIEVDSMHERKQRMYSLADGFVGLPGGLGTLEEVAEIATWAQLGIHSKPVILADVEGFWAPLLGWMDGAVTAGFIRPANRSIVASVASVEDVLAALASYPEGRAAPIPPRWAQT